MAVAVVHLVFEPVTSNLQLVSVNDNDEITAVDVLGKLRLTFAGQQLGDLGSQAAERNFAGVDDVWHYHSDVCVVLGPEGIEAPLGADRSSTQAQCDEFGGFLDDAATAGLAPDLLLSTWDLRPFTDDSEFLVAVLRPA